ncbi:MAG: DUF1801 domain-containing protein [Actinomycetota bacterium]|nr:DUF1801 domain-containing protein [Actinomycetota bacterium]
MSGAPATKKPARTKTPAGEEAPVLAAIAAISGSDRTIGEQLHAVIIGAAPDLSAKTWYGMPAYARDGKIVCFFRSAAKFKRRFVTLGFNDSAKLDDGHVWPISYTLTKLTTTDETEITKLVKRAVSQ